ncbi:hypothetical protein MtrunA17_Chr8g0349291 [Medicago truncatula]|uniref:Transmembrane protein, putative n=1 Tax=Medicago truncatula TaxID=3880 RepID=A0A072TP03_MEDTR|nr:transmembrane protein, putative [Medicago truncatula]RHN39933.1 hypothetical protein MtrunA17_Chr8g0349291 [Medicago truncatula]
MVHSPSLFSKENKEKSFTVSTISTKSDFKLKKLNHAFEITRMFLEFHNNTIPIQNEEPSNLTIAGEIDWCLNSTNSGASTKRSHECWASSGGGIVLEQNHHRQPSSSLVRASAAPPSPSPSPSSSSVILTVIDLFLVLLLRLLIYLVGFELLGRRRRKNEKGMNTGEKRRGEKNKRNWYKGKSVILPRCDRRKGIFVCSNQALLGQTATSANQ